VKRVERSSKLSQNLLREEIVLPFAGCDLMMQLLRCEPNRSMGSITLAALSNRPRAGTGSRNSVAQSASLARNNGAYWTDERWAKALSLARN